MDQLHSCTICSDSSRDLYRVPLQGLLMCLNAQSCLTLGTPWTVAHQAPPSMGFPRQEYWSGLPCLPPGDLPSPGIEPMSLTSPALTGRFFATSTTWDAPAPKSRFPRIYYRAISFFTFIPPAQAPERPRYAFVFYRH